MLAAGAGCTEALQLFDTVIGVDVRSAINVRGQRGVWQWRGGGGGLVSVHASTAPRAPFGMAVQTRNNEGYDSLLLAVAGGHTGTVSYLLSKGALIGSRTATRQSVLHVAARIKPDRWDASLAWPWRPALTAPGRHARAVALTHHTTPPPPPPPRPCLRSDAVAMVTMLLAQRPAPAMGMDGSDNHPLHTAAEAGNWDTVRALVNAVGAAATPSLKNSRQLTPLDIACDAALAAQTSTPSAPIPGPLAAALAVLEGAVAPAAARAARDGAAARKAASASGTASLIGASRTPSAASGPEPTVAELPKPAAAPAPAPAGAAPALGAGGRVVSVSLWDNGVEADEDDAYAYVDEDDMAEHKADAAGAGAAAPAVPPMPGRAPMLGARQSSDMVLPSGKLAPPDPLSLARQK
jgi:hypothetical protein